MIYQNELEWSATPLGTYLMEREQLFFDKAVADIFGFNALQLGKPQQNLLRNCRIPFCFISAPLGPSTVRAEFTALPYANQSIDLLLLPHILEFSQHAHQILREAERILMPEGQLIITGFNPLSLWGLRSVFHKNNFYPWQGKFINLLRVKDWLALLGFEIVGGKMCCYAPPIQREKWLRRFEFLEAMGDRWWALAGGVYFLQAKKKVAGMRLIMPAWKNAAATKTSLAPAAQKRLNLQKNTELENSE